MICIIDLVIHSNYNLYNRADDAQLSYHDLHNIDVMILYNRSGGSQSS